MISLRNTSIKNQLIRLAIVNLLIVVIGLLVFYARVAESVRARNQEYVSDVFRQVSENVRLAAGTYSRLLTTVAYNEAVQNYMGADSPAERYALNETMRRFLAQIVAFSDGVLDIVVRPASGPPQSLSGAATYYSSEQLAFAESPSGVFSGLVPYGTLSEDLSVPAILVGTTAYSTLNDPRYGERLGTLALVLDARSFSAAIPSGRTETEFLLFDRNGEALPGSATPVVPPALVRTAGSAAAAVEVLMIDGVTHLVQRTDIEPLGGGLMALTPRAALLRDVTEIRNVMMVILVLALGAVASTFYVVARNITLPITELTDLISRARSADPRSFPDRLHGARFSEIATLTSEFNSMLDEIGTLTSRLLATDRRRYEAEIARRETQVAMLQSQINPHFLYNTLESISGMALGGHVDSIVSVTRSLSRIFKYAARGADMVELAEELKMLEAYVAIQRERFGERFKMTYDIAPEVRHAKIPKMILQPLVENALTHGFEARREGGSVNLAAHRGNEGLEIRVSDDGVGIPRDRLARLQKALHGLEPAPPDAAGGPIGLHNVHSRLRLIYGGGAGLTIASEPGEGTSVRLVIPRSPQSPPQETAAAASEIRDAGVEHV